REIDDAFMACLLQRGGARLGSGSGHAGSLPVYAIRRRVQVPPNRALSPRVGGSQSERFASARDPRTCHGKCHSGEITGARDSKPKSKKPHEIMGFWQIRLVAMGGLEPPTPAL